MIKAILFDLDGTLIDTEYRMVTIKSGVLRAHGYTVTDQMISTLFGNSFRRSLPKVIPGISDELIEQYNDEYYAIGYKDVHYDVLEIAQASELLRKLKQRGFRLAMSTASIPSKIAQVLDECKWEGLFDVIVSTEDVGAIKPDPKVYQTAIDGLGVKPEECVAIEDTAIGILAAHNAGVQTVICRKEERLPLDQSGAEYYIRDLLEAMEVIDQLVFPPMRRASQQLSTDQCEAFLKAHNWGTLSLLADNGYPYGVPVNYVYQNGVIYFHGAKTGAKIAAIQNCRKVCFTVVGDHQIVAEEYATDYESVIVFGRATIVEDPQEIFDSLVAIGMLCHGDPSQAESVKAYVMEGIARTALVRIDIDHISGKQAKRRLRP